MVEKAKRDVSDWVCGIYLIKEKLSYVKNILYIPEFRGREMFWNLLIFNID